MEKRGQEFTAEVQYIERMGRNIKILHPGFKNNRETYSNSTVGEQIDQ